MLILEILVGTSISTILYMQFVFISIQTTKHWVGVDMLLISTNILVANDLEEWHIYLSPYQRSVIPTHMKLSGRVSTGNYRWSGYSSGVGEWVTHFNNSRATHLNLDPTGSPGPHGVR